MENNTLSSQSIVVLSLKPFFTSIPPQELSTSFLTMMLHLPTKFSQSCQNLRKKLGSPFRICNHLPFQISAALSTRIRHSTLDHLLSFQAQSLPILTLRLTNLSYKPKTTPRSKSQSPKISRPKTSLSTTCRKAPKSQK